MNLNFIGILLVCVHSELFSVVVYSEYTPKHVVGGLSSSISSCSRFQISMVPFSEDLSEYLDTVRLNAVFDFTNSVSYELRLKTLSTFRKVLYFSSRGGTKEKWVFNLHPSPLTEARALQKFMDFLDWQEYHLMTSEKENSRTIYKYLSKDPLLVLSTQVEQQNYDRFIGRTVKSTGNWKVLALTESQGAAKMLQALKNLKIFKERCAFLLSSRATWEKLDTGSIVLSEKGLELAESEEEFEFKAILRALDILDQNPNEITQNEALRRYLEEQTDDHSVSNTFSVLNFTPDRKVVGNVTDTVLLDRVVFPGNVTEFNRSPPIVSISGNLGVIRTDGSFSGINFIMSAGILPMIRIINEDSSLLANFQLEIYGTDCGPDGVDYNYAYASECMEKHLDSLGAFYIDSASENVGRQNDRIFKENGIKIPHTGIFYDDWSLYDKEVYPELYITNAHQLYLYAIIPYILNSFNWKEIVVIFNESVATDLYEAFTNNAEILEISILNEQRFIPYLYIEKTFYDTNAEMLKEIIELKCRVYVLLLELPVLANFIELMYDLGLRRGEAVFISKTHFSIFIDDEQTYLHDREKLLELADGSLTLYQNEYIGSYGKKLEERIADMIQPLTTPFTCFQIDSLLLGVHTIDLMLKIGRNYEDPVDMNYFMRQQLFTGCSGTVSIDSGGNGRNELSFGIRNFYVAEEGWIEKEIGYYTIGIMVPLNVSREIVWPSGSTDIPENMITEPECGIKESEIEYNERSIWVSLYGSFVFFFITIVSSSAIWYTKLRCEIEEVDSRREIMFEDGVEIGIPFIEASQYILLGPGTSIIGYICVFIDLNSTLDHNFWRLIYFLLGICSLWSFSIFSSIILFDRIFPKDMKNLTRYIGFTMLPLISKIGFVPALWMFSRLFECKQGVGYDLTDTFLKDDCHVRCWEGFHLGISIFSLIVLTIYSVLASVAGTVYNEVMDHVSIKTNTFYSFLKTNFNAILVLLHYHLKERFETIFMIIYFILFVFWTLFVLRLESFNYSRLIMWQNLALIGVCGHLSLVLLLDITGSSSIIILVLDLAIVLCLALGGLIFQYKRLPGYFYKRQGRDFTKLLRFAYTSKVNPDDLTLHELDYRHNQNN